MDDTASLLRISLYALSTSTVFHAAQLQITHETATFICCGHVVAIVGI